MNTAAAPALSSWVAQPYAGPGRNIRRTAYIASAIMIPGAFFTAWMWWSTTVVTKLRRCYW